MTDTPWTPGPWPIKPTGDYKRILVGVGLVDGPGGYDVAEVYSDDCDRNEAEANARLIAAAPDMAEALDRLLTEYDAVDLAAAEPPSLTAAVFAARAALAKARGAYPIPQVRRVTRATTATTKE